MSDPNLNAWLQRGTYLQISGRRVFTRVEGPAGAPHLLVLHGFPTSSHDFARALPALSASYRVVLFDHIGFGLSDKPADYSYSLFEQADVAVQVWQQLGVVSGHLLAHDYSTSVTTELLARRQRGWLPIDLRSVTLCNGSIYIHLASLTASQRLSRNQAFGQIIAKLFNQRVFNAQMRRILAKPEAVGEQGLDDMWASIVFNDGQQVITPIQQYLDERARFHNRWVDALRHVDIPAHVLWAKDDPVSVPAIAEAVAADIPGARLTWLPGLGHYPMLEDTQLWSDAALEFIHSAQAAHT